VDLQQLNIVSLHSDGFLARTSTYIMSEASDTGTPGPESLPVHFSVKLVLVVGVPGSQNRKGKLKTVKETRTKVFSLPIDNSVSSYERLLQTIIDRHNQPYKISAQKPYIFQCVVGNRYVCFTWPGDYKDILTFPQSEIWPDNGH
jgi:hypothetical protein